jgi:hypothetical protein
MNLAGIHLHDSGELVWVNPNHVTHVEETVDGSGCYTLVHLASGVVLSIADDPRDVGRWLEGRP